MFFLDDLVISMPCTVAKQRHGDDHTDAVGGKADQNAGADDARPYDHRRDI